MLLVMDTSLLLVDIYMCGLEVLGLTLEQLWDLRAIREILERTVQMGQMVRMAQLVQLEQLVQAV
jgi:phenylalanine-4-hydroxylase